MTQTFLFNITENIYTTIFLLILVRVHDIYYLKSLHMRTKVSNAKLTFMYQTKVIDTMKSDSKIGSLGRQELQPAGKWPTTLRFGKISYK